MMVQERGVRRTTSWHAPALGCVPIRLLLEDRADEKAPWKVASVTEAKRITLGEPDPALFALRPDYPHLERSDYMVRQFTPRQEPQAPALSFAPNLLRNLSTFGETTNMQYGCQGLFSKYS